MGLIVDSGNGNDTSPVGFPYWANAGKAGFGSGIYLGRDANGQGFVLTAGHVVSANDVFVPEGGASVDMTLYKTLKNPDNSDSDLVLYKLDDPDALAHLPMVPITDSLRSVDDQVLMIARGRIRKDPDKEDAPYEWSSTKDQLWGENVASSTGVTFDANGTINDTAGFAVTFNNPDPLFPQLVTPGLTHEAQAAVQDSGGPTFYYDGSHWALTGLMHAIDSIDGDNNPPGSGDADYGERTFISDLSLYADQLPTLVPEPSGLALFGLGSLALLRRRA